MTREQRKNKIPESLRGATGVAGAFVAILVLLTTIFGFGDLIKGAFWVVGAFAAALGVYMYFLRSRD